MPANQFGLKDRGRLAVGAHADVVVFDPETIATGPVQSRFDLPGKEMRLYAEAIGVRHVIVNGAPVVRSGALTGAQAGTVLRSGRDTRTVPVGEAT